MVHRKTKNLIKNVFNYTVESYLFYCIQNKQPWYVFLYFIKALDGRPWTTTYQFTPDPGLVTWALSGFCMHAVYLKIAKSFYLTSGIANENFKKMEHTTPNEVLEVIFPSNWKLESRDKICIQYIYMYKFTFNSNTKNTMIGMTSS